VFREKIREWLKVLRKANCAVVLATQSISDAERSGIIDVLLESCPTKICLANPGAQTLSLIHISEPTEGRRLFEMSLGPLTLAFAGVSDRGQIRQIEDLHERFGADWPRQWLMLKGYEDVLSYLDI
jgi:type IV secretion system protein VirB4